MLPQDALRCGKEQNLIRVISEYAAKRAQEIGAENVFNFSIGNPNVPAPDIVRETLIDLLNTVPAAQQHSYTPAPGLAWVREAVAEDLNRRYGTDYTAGDLYLTAGASAALAIVMKAVLLPGDEVILLAPYYPEYAVYGECFGGKIITVNCRGADFQIDLEALEAAITDRTKVVVVNSPSNPAGTVFSQETVTALSGLLRKKQAEVGHPIYILADEPYRELVFDADTTLPFLPNDYDNTIYTYSYSKCLSMPGERIGYVLVPPKAAQAADLYASVCGAGRILGYVNINTLFQYMLPKVLDKTSDLSIYKTNRDLLCSELTGYGYEMAKPDGAFYLFLKSPEPDDVAFCERAKQFEVMLVPGTVFGYPGYARLSYCVDTDTIRRALPAMEALMKTYTE